jgi:hypothetical protein
MYTRIRTICGGALMLFVLAACGGASPAGAPTAVPTAVPIDAGTTVPDGGTTGEATAYPRLCRNSRRILGRLRRHLWRLLRPTPA